MKVLFIQNNGIQESIGVSNLSGILKANGHQTDLLLVSHTPDLVGAIRQFDPGLVAFSALTGVHHSIQRLALTVKQHFNIPVMKIPSPPGRSTRWHSRINRDGSAVY